MLLFNRLKKDIKKVSFLIAGAQKCGTSSLFNYLNFHPNLKGANTKEVGFFNSHYNYNTKGKEWYHSNWDRSSKTNFLAYEATPGYLYSSFCPSRIFEYNPEMKFICMVRDPIKRVHSSYNMYRQLASDTLNKEYTIQKFFSHRNIEIEDFFQKTFNNPKGVPDLEEYLKEEISVISNNDQRFSEPSFIRRGFYLEQLERFYNFFDRNNFFIIEQKELEADTVKVLDSLCLFLGIERYNWPLDKITTKHHVREYPDSLKNDIFKILHEIYREPNEKFYAHIGKRYDWS